MPPTSLQSAKIWLVDYVGLARDALHIYVGLLVCLGCALVFRWPLRSWRPFLVVAAVALVGEVWDVRDAAAQRLPIDLWANWHDLWNTCFWPLAIMLLARRTRVFAR